jgi:hypothetical protein
MRFGTRRLASSRGEVRRASEGCHRGLVAVDGENLLSPFLVTHETRWNRGQDTTKVPAVEGASTLSHPPLRTAAPTGLGCRRFRVGNIQMHIARKTPELTSKGAVQPRFAAAPNTPPP